MPDAMAFLTEPAPPYGEPMRAALGVTRIVARNPGPMTYHGTNTWLVEEPGGITVIDPGPEDEAHRSAILEAAGGRIRQILVTHTHPDHVAGVPGLRAATNAPVLGFTTPWAKEFLPDRGLSEGDSAGSLSVLHTPGHASDHLCFARSDGVLFTGDHVMSWNTSMVALPDGDMGAYMDGLRRLLAREDTLYLCGHGPALSEPRALVRAMLSHRATREAAVLGAVRTGPRSSAEIVSLLYSGLAQHLVRAAQLTIEAHLGKLVREGKVSEQNMVGGVPRWSAA